MNSLVLHHVGLQVDPLNEALLTDLTPKRPLVRVRQGVLLELDPRLEALAALAADAAPRPLHLVVHRPHVVIEVRCLTESLVADGTGMGFFTYSGGQHGLKESEGRHDKIKDPKVSPV